MAACRKQFHSLLHRACRLLVASLTCAVSACSSEGEASRAAAMQAAVRLDGSSTVFPISEAVAEEFLALEPGLRVTVGVSGTGGGFKKFISGEIDINGASRPIMASERREAEATGLEFLAMPVALDGLSVVVNPKNHWVDYLRVEELQRIWQPGSTIDSWDDLRAEWPALPIRLYGPGTDSGTFDYFTEVITGASGFSRPDYTASEDDNVLVQGVTGDEYALGFFGYAYYQVNQDLLKLVPIDNGAGPVAPNPASINDGSYSPLTRPIFIYLSKAAASRPAVRAFAEFYLDKAGELANEVGYISLPSADYQKQRAALAGF